MALSITALTPQTTNQTGTTYGTVTYGSSQSMVIIPVCWGTSTAGSTITAMTLNGQTCTQLASAYCNNSSGNIFSDVWYILNPTGSSGTLAITYSTALNNGSFAQPFAITGSSGAPSVGNQSNGGNVPATSASASIIVPNGGGAVGIYSGFDVTTDTLSWTNLTLDNTPTWLGQFVTVQGISGHSTGGTGASVTITGNNTGNVNQCLSVAAIAAGAASTPAPGLIGLASAEW